MSTTLYTIEPRQLNTNLNRLRKTEIIPGILYGQSLKEALPIQIRLQDLQHLITETLKHTLFHLKLDDQVYTCLLRTFQTDAQHSKILHVDFQYVKQEEIIKIKLPIRYVHTEFLRSKKLVLEKAIINLPVQGPLENLPEAFVLDVEPFDRGHKIFAKDIPLPENTQMFLHPDTIIATIQ